MQDDPGGAAKFFSKEFQCCLPHGTFLLGIRNTSFQYKLHWVTVERFVFFGKLSLKRPFAFLFAPFCLGLWGVAKFLSEFSTSGLPSPRGTRQAPECLDSIHISVRSRELLKAPKQRFYICPPFAEICPRAISTYNTAGSRETTVSTCSPLLNRSMIKVSTQYAVNLVGILVAGLGRSEIKLLFSCTSDFGC